MKHILIVEDERLIFDQMARFFKNNGYAVSAYAGSYEEAMTEVRRQKPDIALLDVELKGVLNGIDVAEAINKIMQIPLIFISSHQEKAIIDKALKTIPNAYLFKSKTSDLEELLANVQVSLLKTNRQTYPKVIFVYEDYINELQNKRGDKNIASIHLALDKVLYFKTDFDKPSYVHVFTEERIYYLRKKRKELEPLLPNNFILTNRSSIVNLDKVSSHNTSELYIGDLLIKISENNRQRVKDRIASLYLI
jgi:DNA-binding LytR/AlgR family response regulator